MSNEAKGADIEQALKCLAACKVFIPPHGGKMLPVITREDSLRLFKAAVLVEKEFRKLEKRATPTAKSEGGEDGT